MVVSMDAYNVKLVMCWKMGFACRIVLILIVIFTMGFVLSAILRVRRVRGRGRIIVFNVGSCITCIMGIVWLTARRLHTHLLTGHAAARANADNAQANPPPTAPNASTPLTSSSTAPASPPAPTTLSSLVINALTVQVIVPSVHHQQPAPNVFRHITFMLVVVTLIVI